jgi:hypothetical protein
MKKILVFSAVVVVVVVAVAGVGLAYAQTQTPPFRTGFGQMGAGRASGGAGYGPGMMRGQLAATPGSRANNSYGPGMMGGRAGWGMMGGTGYGPMHDFMVDALANELGMSTAEVQSAIQSGKTPYQIAQEKGYTAAQISDLMEKMHDEALQQAVASGALTQEQADWMDQHMQQMWSNGFGPGFAGCPAFNSQSSSSPTN